MAGKKATQTNPNRQNLKNAKAWKKRPKVWDAIKRKLVTGEAKK